MGAHVQRVTDDGDDRITVTGTVDGYDDEKGNPVVIEAHGWVSAMERHHDPNHYGDDGHLLAGAQPRAMDDVERLAYWESLLADSAPREPAPTVLYEGS